MSDLTRILIVEDDVDLIEMLSAYFRVQGYEIMTAGWGEDAVELATETVPHIVLLDIRLPDIDGYEVCRRLRKQRQTRHVPIIFLTEKRERENRLAGLEMGAVDYITKPFDIQELRLRVRNALRRASMNTVLNPVSGLPEGPVVQERLEQMMDTTEWGVVLADIKGITKFRNKYGFVAADDVARAVSLMLTNAIEESGASDHFVGHLDSAEFIIITAPDVCPALAENCLTRLKPAIPYFYPATDRDRVMQLPDSERLSVTISTLTSADGSFKDLEDLRAGLSQVAK
ncbi:MAG TPA: response regulator [Anaerolineae bacterium]|nr:response regulator [Anaerolineae bacterium]